MQPDLPPRQCRHLRHRHGTGELYDSLRLSGHFQSAHPDVAIDHSGQMMLLRFAIPTALVRNLLRRGDGTAALEFALCAPLLLTCMLGVIEFGRVMWTQNALHYAVADAARCMTFDATDCGSAGTTESYAARIPA